MLRAFKQPFDGVRVLIVGQDPYPTPGHPIGLSFSVAPEVRRLPPSLLNIFTEYSADLGFPRPSNGDLTPWTERGVLLLNRVLTVQPRQPGSHRGKGWEQVTEQAIRALAARQGTPLVAILWGRDARTLVPLLGGAGEPASASSRPIRAQIRLITDFSVPVRSAAPIIFWSSRAPRRSTGSSPSRRLSAARKAAS